MNFTKDQNKAIIIVNVAVIKHQAYKAWLSNPAARVKQENIFHLKVERRQSTPVNIADIMPLLYKAWLFSLALKAQQSDISRQNNSYGAFYGLRKN